MGVYTTHMLLPLAWTLLLILVEDLYGEVCSPRGVGGWGWHRGGSCIVRSVLSVEGGGGGAVRGSFCLVKYVLSVKCCTNMVSCGEICPVWVGWWAVPKGFLCGEACPFQCCGIQIHWVPEQWSLFFLELNFFPQTAWNREKNWVTRE